MSGPKKKYRNKEGKGKNYITRYLKMGEINGNITSIEKIRNAEKNFIRKSDGNRPHTNDTEYKEYYGNSPT